MIDESPNSQHYSPWKSTAISTTTYITIVPERPGQTVNPEANFLSLWLGSRALQRQLTTINKTERLEPKVELSLYAINCLGF